MNSSSLRKCFCLSVSANQDPQEILGLQDVWEIEIVVDLMCSMQEILEDLRGCSGTALGTWLVFLTSSLTPRSVSLLFFSLSKKMHRIAYKFPKVL